MTTEPARESRLGSKVTPLPEPQAMTDETCPFCQQRLTTEGHTGDERMGMRVIGCPDHPRESPPTYVASTPTCGDCATALPSVGGLREADEPQPEIVWRYIGKRERVHVRRVWSGYPPMEGCIAVRCHPLHGGRAWPAPLCEFAKRFEVDGA